VPLTSSLYVPGTLVQDGHVIVDVGTGFYVEKSLIEAKGFYEGKVELLGKNLSEIEEVVRGKSENLRLVEDGELYPQFRSMDVGDGVAANV
jgi:prefoldin alpha subunit